MDIHMGYDVRVVFCFIIWFIMCVLYCIPGKYCTTDLLQNHENEQYTLWKRQVRHYVYCTVEVT